MRFSPVLVIVFVAYLAEMQGENNAVHNVVVKTELV